MSTIETTITENIISYLQACNVSIKNFKRFLESETPSFDFNSASDLEYAMANSPSIMIRVLTGQLSKPDAKRMLMPVMPVELQELLSQVTKELEKEDSTDSISQETQRTNQYVIKYNESLFGFSFDYETECLEEASEILSALREFKRKLIEIYQNIKKVK
jgi:hypothetical protein